MTAARRTTIAAPADALDTLAAGAERRGVTLSAVVAEAIEEKAESLRRARHHPPIPISPVKKDQGVGPGPGWGLLPRPDPDGLKPYTTDQVPNQGQVALVCDTGPLLAALDRDDPDHRPCVDHL